MAGLAKDPTAWEHSFHMWHIFSQGTVLSCFDAKVVELYLECQQRLSNIQSAQRIEDLAKQTEVDARKHLKYQECNDWADVFPLKYNAKENGCWCTFFRIVALSEYLRYSHIHSHFLGYVLKNPLKISLTLFKRLFRVRCSYWLRTKATPETVL